MFQDALFDQSPHFTQTHSMEVESPEKAISLLFDASSICDNDALTCTIKSQGNTHIRVTKKGDACLLYRNLNKPEFFSIKQKQGEYKNKVSGYAKAVVLKYPAFKLSEASRQRVLHTKTRNVHSYLTGKFEYACNGNIDIAKLDNYVRVSYSPYIGGYFFTVERDANGKMIEPSITPIIDCMGYQYAVANGSDILLFNIKS